MKKATFAAGCFWGIEERFKRLKGVTKTTVGYIGGTVENPTYRQVCNGDTGHAEAVEVEFDPNVITYKDLLATFWDCHNPTLVNRQGADIGSQYRSAIFYHDNEQEILAKASKDALNACGTYSDKIATEIKPASTFYPAEEYHQCYLAKQRGE